MGFPPGSTNVLGMLNSVLHSIYLKILWNSHEYLALTMSGLVVGEPATTERVILIGASSQGGHTVVLMCSEN